MRVAINKFCCHIHEKCYLEELYETCVLYFSVLDVMIYCEYGKRGPQ
jgi:hypothetical protein